MAWSHSLASRWCAPRCCCDCPRAGRRRAKPAHNARRARQAAGHQHLAALHGVAVFWRTFSGSLVTSKASVASVCMVGMRVPAIGCGLRAEDRPGAARCIALNCWIYRIARPAAGKDGSRCAGCRWSFRGRLLDVDMRSLVDAGQKALRHRALRVTGRPPGHMTTKPGRLWFSLPSPYSTHDPRWVWQVRLPVFIIISAT